MKDAQVWGVVKGFQIACNLAGPLGDLTRTGDQSSGKVVHRDLGGDKSGAGDQLQDKSRKQPARSEQLEKTDVFSSWSNGYR